MLTLVMAQMTSCVNVKCRLQRKKTFNRHTIRQIARKTSMSHSSVHHIIKTDLKVKCLKRQHAQQLTQSNWFDRLQRSRELWKRYAIHSVDFHVVFRWKLVHMKSCLQFPIHMHVLTKLFCLRYAWFCWTVCGKLHSLRKIIQFYCYTFCMVKWFHS